jgi:hypothetical protein
MPLLRPLYLVVALGGGLFAGAFPSACAGQPACEKNSDCAGGTCVDGDCVVECEDSVLDCPIGYLCGATGRCEYGGGGATGQGGAGQGGATTTSGPGGSGGSSTTTTTSSSSSSGSGGAGLGNELDLCFTTADCMGSLSCQPMTKNGIDRCTRTCTSSSQCMSGTRCIDTGMGSYCLGDDIGRSCTGGPDCNYACITGNSYCTAQCTSGSDCPNGYGCMPIGNPATDVCVRVEALCDSVNTADCIAQSACDLSPSLILGSCTIACNSAADCPQRATGLNPWTCDGLCRRPADVYGGLPGGSQPTEWHCDTNQSPVVLCNDAQHIDFTQFAIPNPPTVECFSQLTTPRPTGDSCLNSCRYQGGCTYGYTCVGVGSFQSGQRAGLCLPNGFKEPGQTCVTNPECAFGYCVAGVCSRDCSQDGVCPSGLSCVSGGNEPVEGMPFRRCQ